ncbi:MAG: hypothetical protein HQK53_05730, partial [Oligoflexia bacterium]|nr:hypothetical protein [Oligoflexia bacterium]
MNIKEEESLRKDEGISEADSAVTSEYLRTFKRDFGIDVRNLDWEKLSYETILQYRELIRTSFGVWQQRGVINPFILRFVEDILSKYKFHTEQLNSTSEDLSSFFKNTIGYSGTANVKDKNELDMNLGRVINALHNDALSRNKQVGILDLQRLIASGRNVPSFADYYGLLSPEQKATVHAFIDIGALLKGKNNLDMAKEIYSTVRISNEEIKGVIFFDDRSNKLSVYTEFVDGRETTGTIIEVGGSDENKIRERTGYSPA